MFKLTRRTVACLTAAAAMCGLGTAFTTPAMALLLDPNIPPAQPAPEVGAPGVCKNWEIPKEFWITQDNGWSIMAAYRTSQYTWSVVALGRATHGMARPRMNGTLKLLRFDRSGRNAQVRFTITFGKRSAGIYTGTIDDDGFLEGTMRHKYNANYRASFEFDETINCGRW